MIQKRTAKNAIGNLPAKSKKFWGAVKGRVTKAHVTNADGKQDLHHLIRLQKHHTVNLLFGMQSGCMPLYTSQPSLHLC